MRATAIGPSRAGCHEIPAGIAAEWIRLGGEDIQVWGTDYVLEGPPEAIAYAAEALGLESVDESPEDDA